MILTKIILILLFGFLLQLSQAKKQPLVIDGEPTTIAKYPHSVFIDRVCRYHKTGKEDNFNCGGSILNRDMILTAAHCVRQTCYGAQKSAQLIGINIVVGNTYRHKKRTKDIYPAMFWIEHADYKENPDRTISNDIAIIRVQRSIKYSKNVQPIAIRPTPGPFKSASVAGWGYTSVGESGPGPDRLSELTNLRIWPRKKCIENLNKISSEVRVTPPKGTICLKFHPASSSKLFRGDSGSALIARGDEENIQVGIFSYYRNSDDQVIHNFFVEIAYYYNWIQEGIEVLTMDKYGK